MQKTSKTSRIPKQLELPFTPADSLREQRRRARARKLCEAIDGVKLASEVRYFTAEEFEKATAAARTEGTP